MRKGTVPKKDSALFFLDSVDIMEQTEVFV